MNGNIYLGDVVYLGVDLHCQEKPETGMRLHGVKLLFQLHQPSGGQVDILQHHPPAGQSGRQYTKTKCTCSENTQKKHYAPAGLDSSIDVSVCLIEALSRTCGQCKNTLNNILTELLT